MFIERTWNMKNLKKYTLPVYLMVLVLCLALGSCKSKKEVESNTATNQTDSRPRDLVVTNPELSQLYLMVRLIKPKPSDVPGVIGVERSISPKKGNPLPVPGKAGGSTAFKCDLIGTDDSIIITATQSASFEHGDGKNEAILKFILPVTREIREAVISYRDDDGKWVVLLTEEMQDL